MNSLPQVLLYNNPSALSCQLLFKLFFGLTKCIVCQYLLWKVVSLCITGQDVVMSKLYGFKTYNLIWLFSLQIFIEMIGEFSSAHTYETLMFSTWCINCVICNPIPSHTTGDQNNLFKSLQAARLCSELAGWNGKVYPLYYIKPELLQYMNATISSIRRGIL